MSMTKQRADDLGGQSTTPSTQAVNGFDLARVKALVDAVKEQPNIAQATLAAKVAWKGGFLTDATIKDFTAGGVKNETSRPIPFAESQDHPFELGGGTNKGATAGELLLASLGHCLAASFALASAVSGVQLESLSVEVEGNIDLHGNLGLPEPGAVRPGFQDMKAKYLVKSRASKAQLEEAARMAELLSPVKDSLRAVRFSSQLVVQ